MCSPLSCLFVIIYPWTCAPLLADKLAPLPGTYLMREGNETIVWSIEYWIFMDENTKDDYGSMLHLLISPSV
jgi:hypothetical protein